MLIRFIRNWTLPIAMSVGVLAYFILGKVSAFTSLKPLINEFLSYLTPSLIFAQLLLTFCKIEIRDLKPRLWHLWLLLFQLFATLLIAFFLIVFHVNSIYNVVFEGLLVCLICPTATAAAVVTSKLGGNAASLTTYTLLSNLLAATLVPALFPLIEPHVGLTFIMAFLKILSKVFPLLLFPFFLALIFRRYFPRLHLLLREYSGIAFYLWAVALAVVSGQTMRSLVNSTASILLSALIALAALIACGMQFYLGKRIAGHYGERLSGGQALGQKNTVLAIWMAYTYLTPLSSFAPGSYVLWQNIVNSYQLWKKRKKEETELKK